MSQHLYTLFICGHFEIESEIKRVAETQSVMGSIFSTAGRLISLLTGSTEDKMEAKGQNTLKTRSEMDFFELIERRLTQQGYEVLDTVCPNSKSAVHSKEIQAHKLQRLSL